MPANPHKTAPHAKLYQFATRLPAEGSASRYASLAAEVVSWAPDVIVANQNPLVKAFMAATTTIPIVAITTDPVAVGLVSNLARPGANLTGVSVEAGTDIAAKRLQILKELVPTAAKVAYLLNGKDGERAGVAFIPMILCRGE